ncbi:hypothetical protein [Dyella halodurans]
MVARSFIAPRQFEEVAKSRNSVLLGPRGSGKTTLLRMLDPRALGTWREPGAQGLKESVDYVGVFVPVDTAWISSLQNTLLPLGEEARAGAHMSIYTLAVARSLVDTMVWRLDASCRANEERFYIKLDRNHELDLVRHLASLWLPGRKVLSLLELRLLLTQELAILPRRLMQMEAGERVSALAATESPTQLAGLACDGFNLLANDDSRKWALLCDELEIAPTGVQSHLFAALRATPQNLLLKLALTPALKLPQVPGSEHPVPAHDYDSISLSYATREEGASERSREEFCRGLWSGLVSARDRSASASLVSADDAFERPSHTGFVGSEAVFERAPADARFGSMFRSLASIDISFADYLVRKGVDVSDLDAKPNLLDSVVRKVRPVVEIRSFYLKRSMRSEVGRASRRAPIPYCGAKNIFSVSESHPRWLKSTLSGMLGEAREKSPHISLVAQSREIKFAVSRVVARLKAFPSADEHSTYALIEKIGLFFGQQIVGQRFIADPILSFVVDEVGDAELRCLGNALYIGALVPLDINSHIYLVNGLVGGRFRLSNWLAPHFKLPLVAGKSINLTTLLERSRVDSSLDTVDISQLSLGLDHES